MEMHTDKFFSAFGPAFIETLCTITPDIVFVKDPQGSFLFANHAFERLYGYTLDQIRGKSDFSFMSEEEARYFAQRDQEALAATGPTTSTAWQINHIDDTEECYETIKTPIFDADGKTIGLLGIGRNITKRKRAEDALRALNLELEERINNRTQELEVSNQSLQQALQNLQRTQSELIEGEKLASMGRMITGLAHELNTPIGTAFTVASVLDDQATTIQRSVDSGKIKKSEMVEFVKTIQEGAQLISKTLTHTTDLISTFKQLGVDHGSMQKREFDLRDTVKDALCVLSVSIKDSGVQLISQVPPDIKLHSFPGIVTQVLINLAENAKKHAFTGMPTGTVLIGAKDQGATVEITVQDNGHGIPLNIQDKIFDPFFTTKRGNGGSGLGLSVVHSLVTQGLGGKVRLEPMKELGSKFSISFPKVAA